MKNPLYFKYNKKELEQLLEEIDDNNSKPKLLKDNIQQVKSITTYGKKLNNIEIDESLQEIVKIVNLAQKIIIEQQKDEWDKITVKKDIKQLEESKKMFQNSVVEFKTLQQRLIGTYEDIIFKLNRYFKFNTEPTNNDIENE